MKLQERLTHHSCMYLKHHQRARVPAISSVISPEICAFFFACEVHLWLTPPPIFPLPSPLLVCICFF